MKVPGVDYSSPAAYSLKQRILLAVVPTVVTFLYQLLRNTWRYDIRNRGNLNNAAAEEGLALLAVWHETILPFVPLYANQRVHSIASRSFDGELAARFMEKFGVGTVRGSSTKGGDIALANLLKAAPHVPIVGITVDGPRGPRRVAKAGIVVLAARLQKPIVVSACAVPRAWRMRSWDRLIIPKPFAVIRCDFGEPIAPPPTDQPEDVEEVRLKVEEALNALHEKLDREMGAITV